MKLKKSLIIISAYILYQLAGFSVSQAEAPTPGSSTDPVITKMKTASRM
ncbi:hypothetical protein SAMN04487897_11826 [Paenibacillus sp. yr247]|nr:hypothetical protein SAMN04487897_11826 [Paenibacillus sp. yr247]